MIFFPTCKNWKIYVPVHTCICFTCWSNKKKSARLLISKIQQSYKCTTDYSLYISSKQQCLNYPSFLVFIKHAAVNWIDIKGFKDISNVTIICFTLVLLCFKLAVSLFRCPALRTLSIIFLKLSKIIF